jgi:hypothetical protein
MCVCVCVRERKRSDTHTTDMLAETTREVRTYKIKQKNQPKFTRKAHVCE